jgi:hypothetical protein
MKFVRPAAIAAVLPLVLASFSLPGGSSRTCRTPRQRQNAEAPGEGVLLSFPMPAKESERLAAVRALDILDTAPDSA